MFNIYDYINNKTLEKIYEDGTQVKCKCPCCASPLVISKKRSNRFGQFAYHCTAGCTTKEIRDKLGDPIRDTKTMYNLDYQVYIPTPDPKYIPIRRLEYATISDYPLPIVESRIRKLKLSDTTLEHRTTYYSYNSCTRTVRYEEFENGIRISKKQPPYFSLDGGITFQSGYNDILFPLFNEQYMDKSQCLDYLWVEGEKCAVECSIRGYLALSCASATFTKERLKARLEKLFWNIKGLVIIPDLDTVGQTKADLLQQVSWELGIRTRILDLSQYRSEDENINDIADIFNSKNERLNSLTIEDIIYDF